MFNTMNFLRTAAAASVLGFAVTGCGMMSMSMPWSSSTTKTFGASLSGSSEVPPVTTTGSGTFAGKLDTDTRVLNWTLMHSGLTGPATAAHLHGPAMPGANAGVAVPFSSAMSGSTGQATLTAVQVADLMAGKLYVNVHTAANPGGEIRGQVMAK